MRVAAYQARLKFEEIEQTISRIAKRVADCERAGVDILCCPEAVLGGLADYSPRPHVIAISIADGSLEKVLAPLKSPQVTTIVGFTELGDDGRLYNSAAVWSRGMIAGVYRKLAAFAPNLIEAPQFRASRRWTPSDAASTDGEATSQEGRQEGADQA